MNHGRDHRGWLAIVALLVAVGLAGCGGDDDDDTADAPGAETAESGGADDGSADSGGEGAGESDGSSGAAVTDDDFPIPIADGLVLDALADAGIPQSGQRQLYYPNGDLDRLVAFYDDWTGQNGEWARTEVEQTTVYQSLDTDSLMQITIEPDHDPGAQAEGPVVFVLLIAG